MSHDGVNHTQGSEGVAEPAPYPTVEELRRAQSLRLLLRGAALLAVTAGALLFIVSPILDANSPVLLRILVAASPLTIGALGLSGLFVEADVARRAWRASQGATPSADHPFAWALPYLPALAGVPLGLLVAITYVGWSHNAGRLAEGLAGAAILGLAGANMARSGLPHGHVAGTRQYAELILMIAAYALGALATARVHPLSAFAAMIPLCFGIVGVRRNHQGWASALRASGPLEALEDPWRLVAAVFVASDQDLARIQVHLGRPTSSWGRGDALLCIRGALALSRAEPEPERWFQHAASVEPSSPGAALGIGVCRHLAGDEDAEEWIREAERLCGSPLNAWMVPPAGALMRAIASHISSAPLDDTARGALLAQLQGPDRASALGRRLVAPLQNPAPEFDALFVWLDDATTGS